MQSLIKILKDKFVSKKITYTKGMKEQDELWKTDTEDLDVMEKLYNEILEEARTKGFNGIAKIYDWDNEKIIDIFENKEELELASLGKIEVGSFGYCKPVIARLEEILNK